MTELGASVALAILLSWVVFAISGFMMADIRAVTLGAVVGIAWVLLARDSMALRGMVALLAPFGVMLPALALRHAGVKLGFEVPSFGTLELGVFLLAYIMFLMTAFDVVPVDLYRFGYAPMPVAMMVLAVCGYGLATGNWFLPLVAVLGQAFWVMGWGSSNWFDFVLHVLLVPVTAIALVLRLV